MKIPRVPIVTAWRQRKRTGEVAPPPLPDGVEASGYIAEGSRSHVYEGRYRGEHAVIKVYKPYQIARYRRRYRVHIAQFEYERNLAFYSIAALRRHVSIPLAYAPGGDAGEAAFLVQRFASRLTVWQALQDKHEGITLAQVVAFVEFVIGEAAAHGLHDLDLHSKNTVLAKDERGWKPVIVDFNRMPQYRHPPNPWMAAAFRLGLRDKAHRDRRNIRAHRNLLARGGI